MLQELKWLGMLFRTVFAREKKYLALAQIVERFVAIRIGAMTQHARTNSFDVGEK
jgi:hypothetical protein